MKDLIDELEAAPEGSQELDARVYCERLGIEFDRMNDPAFNPNDPLSFIFHVKSGERYTCWGQDAVTRSLDAKVPGENIISIGIHRYYEKEGVPVPGPWYWAIHLNENGDTFMGRGFTEPLARRIAGLKGIDANATES